MASLRARIILTLVSSILCVAFVVSAIAFSIRWKHEWTEHDNFARLGAEQIFIVASLLESERKGGPIGLASEPAAGAPRPDLSGPLQSELRKTGSPLQLTAVQPAGMTHPLVSVRLDGGWLILPIKDPNHTREVLWSMAGWLALVGAGTVAVAVWFAFRITRNLAVLERVAATIDADGVVPRLPENGPAELKAVARAINLMTARLKSAVDSRMRLVAAAGHDLRTPMTRMRLRAEFLDEDERSMWLSDIDELEQIADSAIQLVREEIQCEASRLVRVDEIILGVCSDLVSLNEPVRIARVEAVTISAPRLALTRAVRNLVVNAATHGGGATVTLSLENASASITIDDEGPGIPDQSMSRVFEPFFRVDPGRRKTAPGAGLGLAIAKEIVERHGGKLTLQNRWPKGLRQRIVFPAGSG